MIRVKGLRKEFATVDNGGGTVLALSDIDFEVRDNEFVMRTDDDQLDRAAVTFRTSDERRVTMLVAGHAFAFKQ